MVLKGDGTPGVTPTHLRDSREEWLTTLFSAIVLLLLAGAVSVVVSLL